MTTHKVDNKGRLVVTGGLNDPIVTATFDPTKPAPWTVNLRWLITTDETMASIVQHLVDKGM